MVETNQDEMEELILIEHELDKTEHNTLIHCLKNFMNTLVAPIGALPAAAVKSLKRQRDITSQLLNSLSSFNKEIAVTDSELNILKKALKNFTTEPLNNIRNFKDYQTAAVALLKEFEIVDNDE